MSTTLSAAIIKVCCIWEARAVDDEEEMEIHARQDRRGTLAYAVAVGAELLALLLANTNTKSLGSVVACTEFRTHTTTGSRQDPLLVLLPHPVKQLLGVCLA
jgi:hypothetical protein